jgi:hypothetical protein
VPRVKVKKCCCKDKPRCKRCPVAWKRLSADGLAERIEKRIYRFDAAPPAPAMKAARAR